MSVRLPCCSHVLLLLFLLLLLSFIFFLDFLKRKRLEISAPTPFEIRWPYIIPCFCTDAITPSALLLSFSLPSCRWPRSRRSQTREIDSLLQTIYKGVGTRCPRGLHLPLRMREGVCLSASVSVKVPDQKQKNSSKCQPQQTAQLTGNSRMLMHPK